MDKYSDIGPDISPDINSDIGPRQQSGPRSCYRLLPPPTDAHSDRYSNKDPDDGPDNDYNNYPDNDR